MIAYINESLRRLAGAGKTEFTVQDIRLAVFDGAVPRVRPLLMTVLANILGLLPILLATGTGSDVMKPIAIPFVFGLISSTLFVLIVVPVIYQAVKEWEWRKRGTVALLDIKD
jgi:Cu(I)/Ag(I) efflux system membrane protein CusA/SilA